MRKNPIIFKGSVSAGMSVELLLRGADIVKDICQPPMEMQRIVIRHLEKMLEKRSKGVAQAIRFQIKHGKTEKEDWEKLAGLVERGLEMEYEESEPQTGRTDG